MVNPHRRNWVAERSCAAIHLDWIIKVEQVSSCRQSIRARVFYLYAIKKDGLIVYVPKKFDLSSVSKLEKLFSLTPFCH